MVTLDNKDYTGEANRQLNDTNNYKKLEFEFQTEKIKSEINNLKNLNLLTLKTADSLLEEKINTLEFDLIPKIIKQTIQKDPLLVLLIATLVEFQNLLIIIYNLR